jgi:hypothetical protein
MSTFVANGDNDTMMNTENSNLFAHTAFLNGG